VLFTGSVAGFKRIGISSSYKHSRTIGHGVDVKKSSLPAAGYNSPFSILPSFRLGLWSSEKFLPGDFIAEYDGVIISRETALENMKKNGHLHFRSLGFTLVIDGKFK